MSRFVLTSTHNLLVSNSLNPVWGEGVPLVCRSMGRGFAAYNHFLPDNFYQGKIPAAPLTVIDSYCHRQGVTRNSSERISIGKRSGRRVTNCCKNLSVTFEAQNEKSQGGYFGVKRIG